MKVKTINNILLLLILIIASESQLNTCVDFEDLFNFQNYDLADQVDLSPFLKRMFPDKKTKIPGLITLGAGSFGRVIKITVTNLLTGENLDLALKAQRFESNMFKGLANDELTVLNMFSEEHPLYSARYLKCAVKWMDATKNTGTVFILTEKVDYNLDDRKFKNKIKSLDPVFVPSFFALMTRALMRFHLLGYCHYDIKTENFAFKDGTNPLIKLIDFGFATKVGASLSAGSPNFMAPEHVTSKICSRAKDNYALGITFYDILIGVSDIEVPNKEMLNKPTTARNFYQKGSKTIETKMDAILSELNASNTDSSVISRFTAIKNVVVGLTKDVPRNRMKLWEALEMLENAITIDDANSIYLERNKKVLESNNYPDNSLNPLHFANRVEQRKSFSIAGLLGLCGCAGNNDTVAAAQVNLSRKIHREPVFNNSYVGLPLDYHNQKKPIGVKFRILI